MNEAAFQSQVVDLAKWCGWKVFHWPDSRRVTQPGWPDLVFVRAPEFFCAELKTNTGRLSKDQVQVLSELRESGIEVHVWRPKDFNAIIARLRH